MEKTNQDSDIKVSVPEALKKLLGGPQAFVRAWRDLPRVADVAKSCGVTQEEARAIAQSMRSAGVKLPKKYQGKTGAISKSMAAQLNAILAGQLVNDSDDDMDEDEDHAA
jgi:hypothetical protein